MFIFFIEYNKQTKSYAFILQSLAIADFNQILAAGNVTGI
jgi:hypothetical protein